MRKLCCCLLVVICGAGQAVAAETQLTVTGDRVNLRAAPGNAKVVAQASRGDVLTAKQGLDDGEWVEIVPPDQASLWVYGELVQDGAVAVSKLLVRCGPGISYRSVGKLGKGDRIEIRGRHAEWLQIAPAGDCSLWVSREYVEPVRTESRERVRPAAPAKEAVLPKKVDEGEREEERQVVRKPPKPVEETRASRVFVPSRHPDSHLPALSRPQAYRLELPAGPLNRLVPSEEQGKDVSYHAVLRPAGFVWRRPSRYRLVQRDKRGRSVTLCFVTGEEAKLASFVGRRLFLRGRQYWVQGVRHPVVVPEKIVMRD